jgi:hypothetical protein
LMAQHSSVGATRTEIIRGKISWHNLIIPDEEKKWKCRIYPDPESLVIINDLKAEGLLNVLKKDDDGYSMAFTRHAEKLIRGKIQIFTAPVVYDAEGKPCDGAGIGHGSDIALKLQVYYFRKPAGTAKGIAARMEGIRILNLVPWEAKKDMTTAQARQSKGLVDTIEPVEVWK